MPTDFTQIVGIAVAGLLVLALTLWARLVWADGALLPPETRHKRTESQRSDEIAITVEAGLKAPKPALLARLQAQFSRMSQSDDYFKALSLGGQRAPARLGGEALGKVAPDSVKVILQRVEEMTTAAKRRDSQALLDALRNYYGAIDAARSSAGPQSAATTQAAFVTDLRQAITDLDTTPGAVRRNLLAWQASWQQGERLLPQQDRPLCDAAVFLGSFLFSDSAEYTKTEHHEADRAAVRKLLTEVLQALTSPSPDDAIATLAHIRALSTV